MNTDNAQPASLSERVLVAVFEAANPAPGERSVNACSTMPSDQNYVVH